jgi:hypothetical protein
VPCGGWRIVRWRRRGRAVRSGDSPAPTREEPRGASPQRHSGRPTVVRLAAATRSGPSGRGRPGSRWLAWAGVLGGLLLVVAAAVTAPAVAAAPAADGKVLLNSTDNTVTPDVPAQTNLYVLALQ